MRVLFAGKQHFGVGGVEASTHQLVTRLVESGHRVGVVAGADHAKVGVRRWPGLGYEAWAVSGVPPGWALRWVRSRFRPDAIVVSAGGSWWHDWTRPLLDAAGGIPTLLYVRDVEALEILVQRGRRPDLVVGNADAHTESARRLGHDAVTVPSLVETDGYRTATTGEYVLFVNPVPMKGLHVALALARARADVPFLFQEAWPLPPSEWRELEAVSNELGNVALQRATRDPSRYYGGARVLLAPYEDYNRPRVVAEAQASGIPVLAFDDPALREAVGPGGLLLPPGASPSAWIDGLAALWDDTATHARLSEAALRHSDRPDMQPDVVVQRFEAALDEVVARHRRPQIPTALARHADHVDDPTVSVIVPARNAASTIDAELGALASQTYPGWYEVVVVDNDSTDETASRARAWTGKVPELRVVSAPGHHSVSHARNVGVRAARGDFLLICDADDEVDPDWVERMVAALASHHLVTGAVDRASFNRPDQYQWIDPLQDAVPERAYGFLPIASGGNLGMRRELLDVVAGFDERLRRAEDIDFSWRASYAGYEVHGEPGAVIRVRMPRRLRTLARTRFRGGVNEALLYRRHRHHGMQAESVRDVAGVWRQLVVESPRVLRDPMLRYEWTATAAKRAGRVAGSIRHRARFL